MEFSYTVSEAQYYNALRLTVDFKISARKLWIETVVVGFFGILFVIAFFMTWDIFSLAMGLVCLAMLAMLNILPRLELKRRAQQQPSAVEAELTPEKLTVRMGEATLEAPLDGSVTIKQVGSRRSGKLITLFLRGGKLVVLPVEAIPAENREQALAWLLQKPQKKADTRESL